MNPLPQVKPVSVRQSVVDTLRCALLERRFAPGEALPEAGLAAQMKVSRGPVREALLMLAQEGLVTHSQNYGFSVVNLTESDDLEVRQIRLPLEALALELARGQLDARTVESLTGMKVQMVGALRNGQVVDCAKFDLAFHSLIWERSGNSRLALTLRTLLAPHFAYRSAFRASRADLTPELMDEQHQRYLDYLCGASDTTAEHCVRFHLGARTPSGRSQRARR